MVLDTSALIAILTDEPERRAFNEAIEGDPVCLLSAANALETRIVLLHRFGEPAVRLFDGYLYRAGIEIVAVTAATADLAYDAYRTFGRGRHAAALNFGDCFAYALARETDEPLLFKGGDFSKTDIVPCL